MPTTPELTVIRQTPWSELESMLREITLYDQPDTRPYADARISIERFNLSELRSTTRYVQEDLLAVQGVIRASLLPQGYDQLDLKEGQLVLDDGRRQYRIMPPVVERYEPDGMYKYILDGSHRAELARRVGHAAGEADPELTVIYVRDGIASPPTPFPIPGTRCKWSQSAQPTNQPGKITETLRTGMPYIATTAR